MYKIVLCNTLTEASAYAKDQGFKKGSYRYASRAATIRGLRVAEVHQLPSYAKRFDKHAINQTLRFARNLQHFVIDPESWVWPRPKTDAVVDQGDGMGPQITIEEAIAAAEADMIAEGSPVLDKSDTDEGVAVVENPTDPEDPNDFAETGDEPIVEVIEKPKPAPKPRKPRASKPKNDAVANFFVDLDFNE